MLLLPTHMCRRCLALLYARPQFPVHYFSRTNSSLLQFEKSTCLPHSRKLTKHDDVNDVIDYKYFLNIIKTLEKLPKDVENLSLYLPRGMLEGELASTFPEPANSVGSYPTLPGLQNLAPSLPTHTETLAPFVTASSSLRNLVDLGTDLSLVQYSLNSGEIINLLELSTETLNETVMFFAKVIHIPENMLGEVITKNPGILLEDMDNLNIRLQYLKSKKFSNSQIQTMCIRYPKLFSYKASHIDTTLGYIQKIFQLSGVDIRSALTKYPRLLETRIDKLQINRTALRQFCNFSVTELKNIFINHPKLYSDNMNDIIPTYEYLRFTIGYPQEHLVCQPVSLRARVRRIDSRHKYLKLIGRDQFDASKPNFVSVESLILCEDKEFCEKTAKTSYQEYVTFQKTL